MVWYQIKNGKTVGAKGSENGIIIDDIENINGARITLEKDGDIAPFAVTIGIYGLMFHTDFFSNEEEARYYINQAKEKVQAVLEHLIIDEDTRGEDWSDRLNGLTGNIVS